MTGLDTLQLVPLLTAKRWQYGGISAIAYPPKCLKVPREFRLILGIDSISLLAAFHSLAV